MAHALLRCLGVQAPSPSWNRVALVLTACGGLLLASCERQPRSGPVKEPPPAPTSEDTIHLGPLSGNIDGKPFTAKTARYYVDNRQGYEKVEIKLYGAGSKTPCGELDEPKPPSVWLRRVGSEKLTAEKASTTVADGGKWEVHYQVQDDGFWIGNGEANALVVLEVVGPDMKLPGVLSACFRDTTGSCVAGEFSATYCRTSFDEPVRGTEAMERPKKMAPMPPSASAGIAPAPSGSAPPPAPSHGAAPEKVRP